MDPDCPHGPRCRHAKKAPIRNESNEIDLVLELMEVDGLTLAEARTLAAVAVQPRTSDEWLAPITELDDLIERYCSLTGTNGEVKDAILGARCTQSVASIPDSLAWFLFQLSALEAAAPLRQRPSAQT